MKDLYLAGFIFLNILGALATMGVLLVRKASTATVSMAVVVIIACLIICGFGHYLIGAIILASFSGFGIMWLFLILFLGNERPEESLSIRRAVELMLSIVVSSALLTLANSAPEQTFQILSGHEINHQSHDSGVIEEGWIVILMIIIVLALILSHRLIGPIMPSLKKNT